METILDVINFRTGPGQEHEQGTTSDPVIIGRIEQGAKDATELARERELNDALLAARREEVAKSRRPESDDPFIKARDCRNDRIKTHRQLKALLAKEAIRNELRGQHLFVHAVDWIRWNAEQDKRDSDALERPVAEVEKVVAEIRAQKKQKAAKKSRKK